jgi:lysophospholipase L1-like esterase
MVEGRRRLLGKLGLALAASLAGLLVVEVTLRLAWPEADAFYVFWPRLERVYHPEPGVMPGISGDSVFLINSRGVRGNEPEDGDDVRVLTLGGSSTECLFLDQSEAWPQVLQTRLNESQSGLSVWVGNVGKSGMNARDHATQVRAILGEQGDIDLLVVLVGVNDLFLRLQQDVDFDPQYLEDPEQWSEQMRRGFALLPVRLDVRFPPWKRLALWRLGSRIRERVLPSPLGQDDAGSVYTGWRAKRRSASRIRTELPELTGALEEYGRNLERIIDVCEELGVRPVFVTQPTMWGADLAPELAELMWFGGVGDFMEREGCEYYSLAALAEGMRRYNALLTAVTARRGVECLDVVPELPRDTRTFFDDCHFNEEGAARLGELVSRHLLAQPPFRE